MDRGSVSEVVDDGRTGFVVDTPDQLVDAIGKVGDLDRAACRAHVERHFDLSVMVEGYERLFRALAEGQPAASVRQPWSARRG
jgi:glycosyltransferase involved in cell wall biosynthesis